MHRGRFGRANQELSYGAGAQSSMTTGLQGSGLGGGKAEAFLGLGG